MPNLQPVLICSWSFTVCQYLSGSAEHKGEVPEPLHASYSHPIVSPVPGQRGTCLRMCTQGWRGCTTGENHKKAGQAAPLGRPSIAPRTRSPAAVVGVLCPAKFCRASGTICNFLSLVSLAGQTMASSAWRVPGRTSVPKPGGTFLHIVSHRISGRAFGSWQCFPRGHCRAAQPTRP